jgi:nicotinamide riboside transporter PnuC
MNKIELYETTVKENLQYTAKLAGSAALSFLKINVPGQLFIGLISSAIFATLLFQSVNGGAHAGAETGLLIVFFTRPWASLLALLFIIGSPILLFFLEINTL